MTLRVDTGLNALAGISKAIKQGRGSSVPTIYRRSVLSIGNSELVKHGSSIEQGANAVLAEVGINPNLFGALGITTRGVTTSAVNTAKGVFSDVVTGNFGLSTITTAVSAPFNALSELIDNIQGAGSAFSNSRIENPSPFAVDKASLNNHPKFKFLFVAEFIFENDFQNSLNENANNMAFVVRTASRPNVSVEYEDINMYNFKTKVAKHTTYQPISMSFYDDQSNQTTSFYKKYLELLIPNMNMGDEVVPAFECSSFNFSDDKDLLPFNSSSLQALPGRTGHKNIIKSVRLFHIWGWGQYVNVYKFHNPKISEINVSDLDMDSNELAEIQIQFSYDGLNIETTTDTGKNISMNPSSPDSGGYNVPEYSSPGKRAQYPLQYNGLSNENVKMNGNNSDLPEILHKKSLDIVDFTNPSAPDSDFRPELKDSDSFPDFGKLLSDGFDGATNLLSQGAARVENTLSAARSVFGNNIPNVNNLAKLFGSSPIGNIASTGLGLLGGISNQTKTVPPSTEAQRNGDFRNPNASDSEFL